MSSFISRLTPRCGGARVAVKDNIDVAGFPTTAGSRAVAATASAAVADARCVALAKASGGEVVGKTNLHELALGATGINPWYGTPRNPIHPECIPGGSSSGSAVAVATMEADIGIGTDTGGSVRIPAACCGILGLKPSQDRVSVAGVLPLAPSLDAVGFLARSVDALVTAMRMQEGTFSISHTERPMIIGRVQTTGEPNLETAIDAALSSAEFTIRAERVPMWGVAYEAALILQLREVALLHGHLLSVGVPLGDDVAASIQNGMSITDEQVEWAKRARLRFTQGLQILFQRVQLLALPTLTTLPPTQESASRKSLTLHTRPVNLLGLPALSLPLPMSPLPGSLQLVGPSGSEELLLSAGQHLEAAVCASTF